MLYKKVHAAQSTTPPLGAIRFAAEPPRLTGLGRGAMIQYLLLQNRQGKTRLSKYYRPYTDEEKHKLEGEIHRLVTTRDPKFTNFVEVRAARGKRRTRRV